MKALRGCQIFPEGTVPKSTELVVLPLPLKTDLPPVSQTTRERRNSSQIKVFRLDSSVSDSPSVSLITLLTSFVLYTEQLNPILFH